MHVLPFISLRGFAWQAWTVPYECVGLIEIADPATGLSFKRHTEIGRPDNRAVYQEQTTACASFFKLAYPPNIWPGVASCKALHSRSHRQSSLIGQLPDLPGADAADASDFS